MSVNTGTNIHSLVIASNMFLRKDDKYLMIKRSSEKNDLPNLVHSIGGKVDPNEDPYDAAVRELKEESGLDVTNVRLEAVVTEVIPDSHPKYDTNWQVFYFSGDYAGGEVIDTPEGELVWMTPEEIVTNVGFPSLKETIRHIVNPADGVVFARFEYDNDLNIVAKQLHITPR